jgi:hypothetical protein
MKRSRSESFNNAKIFAGNGMLGCVDSSSKFNSIIGENIHVVFISLGGIQFEGTAPSGPMAASWFSLLTKPIRAYSMIRPFPPA